MAARYRFGPFELDVGAAELCRHGKAVCASRRPVEILAWLIERRGQVVSRDELREHLWPGGTPAELDDALDRAVYELRDALDDTADNPRYVETVPLLGYRFVADVEPVAGAPPATRPAPASPARAGREDEPAAPAAPLARRKAAAVAAVAALTILALAGGLWAVRDRLPRPAPAHATLVVLPFENGSGDPADEFFSDGVTDETIAQLGALDPQRLGVVALTTAMHYKASGKDAMQVGRELGADYLLDGSVRRDASRVRITARMVDIGSQAPMWTETFEQDLRDVLMLQRDVAARIAQSLGGGVLSPVLVRATRRSPSPAAYERALRGRAGRQQPTEECLRVCVAMFEQAVALDAEYAAAHAGLADCYRLLGGPGWEVGPPGELLGRARAAADLALELDPELPEGYAARGMVRFSYDWDLTAADRDLARAIALNPSYARAHEYRSAVLTAMGRFDEAVESARRATELDPLSSTGRTNVGVRLYYAGLYDEAVTEFRQTLPAHPVLPLVHWGIGQVYRQTRRHDEALQELQTAAAQADQSAHMRAWLAHALAEAGRREQAEAIRSDLTALARTRYVGPFLFALMAAGLGETDAALEWLAQAREARSGWIPLVPVEPPFAWLRGDPRFQQLAADIRGRPPVTMP